MKHDAHSAEFALLTARWLDETATAEEAARLWQAVAENPDCASEFAAATRFEALLESIVKEREAHFNARPTPDIVFPRTMSPKVKRPGLGRFPGKVWLAAAAAIVLGFLVGMLWPDAQRPAPKIVHETVAPIRQPSLNIPPTKPDGVQSPSSRSEGLSNTTLPTDQVPLTERLDRYFLTGVSLERVTLAQALGILQGQLQQVDSQGLLALERLKVQMPVAASIRLVSFHSGPIPFLKAVRAVAALAGCEVLISEPNITITIQPSVFPQVPEQRTLGDVLAGRMNAEGAPLVNDPARLAALQYDAASLGMTLREGGRASATRGQWEALKLLTDTRDIIAGMALPLFQIYSIAATDPPEQERNLSQADAEAFSKSAANMGLQPIASFTPKIMGADNFDLVQLQPVGEGYFFTPKPNPEIAFNTNTGTNLSSGEPSTNRASVSPIANDGSGFVMNLSNAEFTLAFASQGNQILGDELPNNTSPTQTIVIVPVVAP